MLQLTIQKQLKNGYLTAKGIADATHPSKGKVELEADVLLQLVEPNSVKLVLDSNVHVSKIAGREVELYTNAKPTQCTEVKPGAQVKFENKMWFTLKKSS